MMDVVKHPYINYTVRVTEGDEFVRDFTSQSSLYLNLNSVEKGEDQIADYGWS